MDIVGEEFVLTEEAIFRGSNGGTEWVSDEMILAGAIKELWGRSSNDVYVATYSRIVHCDGKAWISTSYVRKVAGLTGAPKEMFVLRANE